MASQACAETACKDAEAAAGTADWGALSPEILQQVTAPSVRIYMRQADVVGVMTS